MANRHPRTHSRRPELRASDADREATAKLLREHYSAGRLSDDELSERVEQAYGARTLSELTVLTLDLGAPELALPTASQPLAPTRASLTPAGRAMRTSFSIHLTVYLLVNVMLIGIWAASGGGYFWPVWPILGWGIGLGGHYAPVRAGLGTRPRRRRAYALAAPASVDEVAATVGSERPSLRSAAAPDGTVTIVFSDIEGSTQLNERLGDLRWLELLRAHHAVVREQVEAHGGFEVKSQGDGFMIAFPSARSAVRCARAIQRAIASALGDHPDGPIRVRVGLHTGEVMREEADFYGRNVVLAARIAAQARGGEILVSAVVKQLTESAGDIRFEDEREVELPGLAGTHQVYRVA
jgi:class 3 adenylate cyclase